MWVCVFVLFHRENKLNEDTVCSHYFHYFCLMRYFFVRLLMMHENFVDTILLYRTCLHLHWSDPYVTPFVVHKYLIQSQQVFYFAVCWLRCIEIRIFSFHPLHLFASKYFNVSILFDILLGYSMGTVSNRNTTVQKIFSKIKPNFYEY